MKNIVICCDGTGNEIGDHISNVLKLYRIVRRDSQQRVYYDPGIGTLGNVSAWNRLRSNANGVFGLMTGYGLDENILGAYRFLAVHYQEGDQVYLFGYSRGAYTVRVLAGLLHLIGLLRPDQLNICDYALAAYKRASEKDDLSIGWHFGRVARCGRVPIKFVGVWDTVASVIVPRKDRLYLPSLQTLPYTRNNPSVEIFRHAIAIDERRRMFRLNRWEEPQPYVANPFNRAGPRVAQDIKQVWFAGVHGDIGGGYPEADSGLSKFPLDWMIGEAEAHGMRTYAPMRNHLVRGAPRTGSDHDYVAPNAEAKMHNSLTAGWWPLEVLPRRKKFREHEKRRSAFGLYMPWGEPRLIPDDALIHQSAIDRKDAGIDYAPKNLPARYQVEL